MPVYEYEVTEGDCRVCHGRLTLRRPADAPELTRCPLCKKAVRKLVSAFNTPVATRAPSVSEAKNAGFKIYKKTGTGEYERQ
jgi:putative FmdB family regulatory protein